MVEPYPKPHLTYEEQVQKMQERGIQCSSERALELVTRVGYYRLSAYVYPFRVLLPREEQCKVSPVHYRSEKIRSGTKLSHVEGLWQFDRRLRLLCLDALETIEVALRTRVAYVLGRRDRFGHLNKSSLDSDACDQIPMKPGDMTRFELWIRRYGKLRDDARREDYVVHHAAKHGDPLPVWVAVEFFDFGALSTLFGLMDKADQNEVAQHFGVSGGRLLATWMRDLNYLRNLCAHHQRLWNRNLTYRAKKFNRTQVGPHLSHAASCGSRERIYVSLAVLAYLNRSVLPDSTWHLEVRDLVKAFPSGTHLSPERDMGFVPGWADLALWNDLVPVAP
ncbi:Abi family protein [Rhodococcus pyridinivorans]|uniref:Abi family protein n=1 Tax=Rhodococcus pyridinivorans TaxID=103816 RepID=UPI00280BB431|nr:Abi family protein [Rhodococcus pyridinivorans]WMM73019.1 Abi family protein [Rhodococcus pyridinivorans]